MKSDFDIIVFGSGFGGSLMSLVACRLGLRVLLVERGSHPRFAIGESTSPLTNLLLEEIAIQYNLPCLLPFTTFGEWKRTYPEIPVGLKRGFTYYSHTSGEHFGRDVNRLDQLMVAASPSNEVSDTHWYRAGFDHFLLNQAVDLGVEYIDNAEVLSAARMCEKWRVSGARNGAVLEYSARILIDATGPRGLLHRLLGIKESLLPDFPDTQALFSHFTDVSRCADLQDYCVPGSPPFTPDDAALHHTFDGGWMWVLRFNNGLTSAGISVTDRLADELGLPGDCNASWQSFLNRFPSIAEHLDGARPARPFVYSPRLSFRSLQAAGEGWAMLPSAAAFVDPLFSTGIPLTLLGIERLGAILSRWHASSLEDELDKYGELTLKEADSTAEFIGASLRTLPVFPVFAAFSMFYFAAASYSEMARRLDRRHLVTRYLAADRSDFRGGMRRCIDAIRPTLAEPTARSISRFENLVAESIDCLNIAGLSDTAKHNWYGVDLNDVVINAHKLEMSPEAVESIISSAPWARS